MFQTLFWRNKIDFFFFSFFSLSPLFPQPFSSTDPGLEGGVQDLWQEQERLHRGQGVEVGDDDPRSTTDGRRVSGVLERGRPERRWQAGLQRVHQDYATVLKSSCVLAVWEWNKILDLKKSCLTLKKQRILHLPFLNQTFTRLIYFTQVPFFMQQKHFFDLTKRSVICYSKFIVRIRTAQVYE